MAVEKIIPKGLDLDSDPRLLEAGMMTDAMNAVMSKNKVEANQSGVIRNQSGVIRAAYGNSAATFVTDSTTDGLADGKVIGSIADNQRNRVYFFFKHNTDNSKSSINVYYSDTSNHEKIFEGSWLNFTDADFVKADIVNGNFAQRNSIETILYFTDGVNPPRKINVDRALSGDYDGYTNTQLDLALNCIKGASTTPPSFRFENDSNVSGNNLKTDSFQFATQFIYKDGEESAISSYSSLAASKHYFDQGVGDGDLFGYNENVCKIDTNWYYDRDQYKDVVKVRLLARKGNIGNFVVLDELPTNKNVSRRVFGQSTTIWNFISGIYRFYNDSIYGAIDSTTVNKLYDAVPFTATGQAVAQNRLFFSDYTEFRPNGNDNGEDISASLTAIYPISFSFSNSSSSVFTAVSSANGWTTANLTQLDFSNSGSTVNATDIIPANSQIKISLIEDYSGGHIEANTFTFNDGAADIEIDVDLVLDNASRLIEYDITNSQEISIADLAIQYKNFIDSYEFSISWSESNAYGTDPSNNQWGAISFDAQATIKFNVNDQTLTDGVFIIQPYVDSASVSNVSTTQTGYNFVSFDFASSGTITQLPSSSHLTAQLTQIERFPYSATFKAGCSHDIGVVYYDEHGRSSFVNKLGNFYAKHFAERDPNALTDPEGLNVVGVEIGFSNDAPSWAKSYQIVYTGRNTFSDFTTYTVGQAYPEAEPNDNNPVDGLSYLNEGKLYVSLKTLDLYQKEKSALRDYSFTPGDKLRVISYKQDDGTTVYPKANDGSIIEFDIVDVVTLTSSNNEKIAWASNGTATQENEKYQGTFLVIDQPKITQGNTVTVGQLEENLSYQGFDWYQVTGTNYPSSTSVSQATTLWGQGCVVELLTPRDLSEDRPYYEIGERHPVLSSSGKYASNHGPVVKVFNGDVWWKKVACKSGVYDATTSQWTSGTPKDWEYLNNDIESSRINDFKSSEDWSKGRAHYVFENAATFRRYNGITYSDAYEEDVHNLSLSSFNATLSNFYYLEKKYGALNYIGNFNGNLLGVQENKMSMIPCKSNIIQYADGSAGITMSTDVLGLEQYASADFGVSYKDRSSVLIADNQAYFCDRSRRALLRYSADQLTPISKKGVESYFYDQLSSSNNTNRKIVSGYDTASDTYYVSMENVFTLGYNAPKGWWQSFYSFIPDFFDCVDSKMITYKNSATDGYTDRIVWSHSNASSGAYYLEETPTYWFYIEVVANNDPSKVKVLNAVSYESGASTRQLNCTLSTDINNNAGDDVFINASFFKRKENAFYAQAYKTNSNTRYRHIGKITGVSTVQITLAETDFSRTALQVGSALVYKNDNGVFVPMEAGENTASILSISHNENKIEANVTVTEDSLDKELYVILPQYSNGESLRGHWMKIKLDSNQSFNDEVYCVNAHISESKLSHSFNQ